MKFEETTLGNVLYFYNGKSIRPGGDGDYPVYGSNGIIGGSSEYRYENCIIIGRVGAYCGSVNYCRGRFWASDNTIVVKPKLAANSTQFFAYLLQTMSLNRHAGGSAQPLVTHSTLKVVTASIPAPVAQARIASILSAYDDLIENNTRRMAILEEMARCIYEEWFVRFRFPGHEGACMVESESGLMPEGWESKSLGELVLHHIGGGWGQEFNGGEFAIPAYVIRGTDIPDVRSGGLGRSPLRFHTPSNFRSRQLQARDIVFEVSGGSKDQPVGRAVMVGEALLSRADAPVICASFCKLVRADSTKILPELLQFHFDRIYENRQIMQYQTQSTGITNFKFSVFLEKEMVLQPSAELQNQFASIIRPILQLSENLGIRNSVLRATRDFLLPKLISGEIDVSEIPNPESIAA